MQVSTRKYGGKPTKWIPPRHDSDATTIWCYVTCIKGFIDMVKGLLALVLKVFKSFSLFLSNYFVKYGIYSSQKKWRENKAIIKQKNQSAQKNDNSLLLNTRVKTNKGIIPSFGFGVMETMLGILNDRHKCSNSNLNLNNEEKLVW